MPDDYAMGRPIKKTSFIVVLILALLLAALLFFRQMTASSPLVFNVDTDGNGPMESYRLEDHQVFVKQDGNLIWVSPPEWKVTHLLLGDFDNDGQEDILMVLWKQGSFGSSRPAWSEGPDDEYSNHLFMYRLAAGKLKPVWCSSAIPYPILDIEAEPDENGIIALIVTEGPPTGHLYPLRKIFHREQTIWEWQDWGFVRK
ncbi:MAG: hypothetical protein GX581_08995 [Syntrophomonadaceae bacterium]|jgi:hypothetical protein|nr:hypothetical protein [Syntrophomonadaceae bacterium]